MKKLIGYSLSEGDPERSIPVFRTNHQGVTVKCTFIRLWRFEPGKSFENVHFGLDFESSEPI